VRVLLVRLDGIGDAAVCAPLLLALRDAGHEVGAALTTRNAGLFAPGALIFSFTEGLIILSGCIHGVGLALVGVDKMAFKRPLFAGDTMRVTVEVTAARPTSKGDRGIVTFIHRVLNQNNEEVMECTVSRMLKGRNYKDA